MLDPFPCTAIGEASGKPINQADRPIGCAQQAYRYLMKTGFSTGETIVVAMAVRWRARLSTWIRVEAGDPDACSKEASRRCPAHATCCAGNARRWSYAVNIGRWRTEVFRTLVGHDGARSGVSMR